MLCRWAAYLVKEEGVVVAPKQPINPQGCTSLIRNTFLLGPYNRTISRVLWWS